MWNELAPTRQHVGTETLEDNIQAITLKDAERNLPRLVEQVLADAEPRIVVNPVSSVASEVG